MNEKLISERIRIQRAKMNYTKEKTAELLGVSGCSYRKYENKPSTLKLKELYKLADIFQCSIDDFLL